MKLFASKSTGCTQREAETYPCLREGKCTGKVLLLTSYTEGTVVYSGNSEYPIGYHCTDWDRGDSKPYLGKITLEHNHNETLAQTRKQDASTQELFKYI